VFTRRDEAARYGINRNGLLLYGPPGCGKTFFAEAIAGEFGLAFMPVPLGSALTKWVGGAGEPLEKVFAEARQRAPVLVFLDELDAIAPRRDDVSSGHEQQAVTALLQQIDAARAVPGLVLAAATNRLEALDPAVIREGRFDYKVKIYRPDFDARRAILDVQLHGRPHDRAIDTSRLAQRTDGFSAAQLRHLVDGAALAALEAGAPIAQAHLDHALQERLAESRYAGPTLTWDDLILPAGVRRALQAIERFIEHPELADELGVALPTGALLSGPPGTGKTTIARVLASQTDATFLTVGPSDIYARWLGESEQRVKELFERARDSVPAIIFIDEIDAVLGRRGEPDSGAGRAANAVVTTFLAEMDGIAQIKRVFVLGATNRPDLVDEAVLRPGRLSERIELGLPDAAGRLALLQLFTAKMRMGPDVDLTAVAQRCEGASGADLRGLVTAAGRNGLLRILDAGGATGPGQAEDRRDRTIVAEDFARALDEIFPAGAKGGAPAIGFR
jgi:transitional endoplasmic reticulum ATPase